MPLTRNKTLIFVSIPERDTELEMGVHLKIVDRPIDLDNVPLAGGVLVKGLAVSSDPYMRYRFRDPRSPADTFVPAAQLDFAVDNIGVGKVVRSDDPLFRPGDIVFGYLDFAEYCVYPGLAPHFFKLPLYKLNIHPSPKLSYASYLGVLGHPAHTAYSAWHLHLAEKIKTARTMYISSGASSVGTFALEYSRLKAPGLKIIASASTEEKVALMRESGADVPFNYTTQDVGEIMKQHGPIDIYWDNVGGATLDVVLENMATGGVIMSCGSISTVNAPYCLKNWEQVFKRQLAVYGFLVYRGHMSTPMDTFFSEVEPLVVEGKLSDRVHLYHGLESSVEALQDVHTGKNLGKAVVIIADE